MQEKKPLMYADEEGERIPTWNPHPGCAFNCLYCYGPQTYARSKCQKCRKFVPHSDHVGDRLKQKFTKGKTYFVESLGDPAFIPRETFQRIVNHLAAFPETWFMIQSKDPLCFRGIAFPPNVYIGTTIETNNDRLAEVYSKAPVPSLRANGLWLVSHEQHKLEIYVTLEPIMVFDLLKLLAILAIIGPKEIYIGRDNHNKKLPEPSEEDLMSLVTALEDAVGAKHVHRKTLGPAWWEKR